MAEAKPKFEKDLEKLEDIVESLEEGELPLDTAIKKFEEGIKLYRRCEKALSEAEKKIEVLVKDAQGAIEAKPFDEDEADDLEAPVDDDAEEEDDPEEEELF